MKSWGQALALLAIASCGTSPPPRPFVGKLPAYDGGHFAIMGDTQRTTFIGLVLQNENNDPERQLLLPMLASRRPAFVVMLGDLVLEWIVRRRVERIEERAASLRAGHIPVVAVLGNHEYMLGSKAGVRHFFARLPDLDGECWYERTHGPLGMLFLNSNVDKLTAEERDAQLAWYRGALARMQSDPNVQGILVFMHHAPFTNNSLVGDDDYVQLTFVGRRSWQRVRPWP